MITITPSAMFICSEAQCQAKAQLIKHLHLADAGPSVEPSAVQRQPGPQPLARAQEEGKKGGKKRGRR